MKPDSQHWRKHLPEFATITLVLLLSLGLLGFVVVADQVTDGNTRQFDRTVVLALRDAQEPAELAGPAWMETVVRDITALGGTINLSILTLAAVLYISLLGKYRLAVFVAVSVVGGAAVNNLLKHLISRPRPDLVPHATDAAFSSFPSGHAMMSTIVFLTLGAMMAYGTRDPRIKRFFLFWAVLLSLLVGISRVYLGVHWPTDIIAGWIAGATWALLCLLIWTEWVSNPDR